MAERRHDHRLTLDDTTPQLVWLVPGPFRIRKERTEKLKEPVGKACLSQDLRKRRGVSVASRDHPRNKTFGLNGHEEVGPRSLPLSFTQKI